MGTVKARLSLRYRPISDTVVALVRSVVDDRGDEIAGFDSNITSEKLDADTLVEWSSIDGHDVLVALQQMHASVRTMVDGLPPVVAILATELIEKARAEHVAETSEDLVRSYEVVHEVSVESVRRPRSPARRRRAPKATSKGVEAALVDLAERIEQSHQLTEAEAPVVWAIRDLAYSVSDGEGLSSERTADAAARTIRNSGLRSRTQRQQLLSIVNDLRSQSNWSRAIQTANSTFGAEPALDVSLDGVDSDE